MAYRYLEDWTQADIAFEARGESLESLFSQAVDATMNVMVSDLGKIEGKELQRESLTAASEADLLHDFLQRVLYHKDAEQLLLRVGEISIKKSGDQLKLESKLIGEKLNPNKHELVADVKAVTHHRFDVRKDKGGWRATAVLDV